MASASIDQQIMEKLQGLTDSQKQRVLEFVEQELNTPQIPLDDWLKKAAAFREELRVAYGDNYFFNTQSILDEIREEASWPRSS